MEVRASLRPEIKLLGISLAGLVFLLISYAPIMYTDIWVHLKYGQWISTNGKLPDHELFIAWSDPNERWQPTCWLSQWVFAQAHDWAKYFRVSGVPENDGTVGLRWLHAFVTGLQTWIMFIAFCRLGKSAIVGAIATLLALGLDWVGLFVLRPQIFGELGLSIFLLALSSPVPHRWAWLLYPPVLTIWANCHGSFLVGLLLLFGALAGQFFQTVHQAGGLKHLRFRHLFYSLGVRRTFEMLYVSILMIGLFNPVGFSIYKNAWQVAGHPNVQTMDEWQPMHAASPWFILFIFSLIVLLVTFLISWVNRNRSTEKKQFYPLFNTGQILIALIFGIQVLLHQRMMLWWSMLVPYLCVGIWGQWIAALRSETQTTPVVSTKRGWLVSLLMAALLAVIAYLGFQSRNSKVLYHTATPHRALPAIQNFGRPITVFASETVSEYLIHRLTWDYRLLCHTHVHSLPIAHWQNCLIVKNAGDGAEKLLKDWDVRCVVVERWAHPGLCALLRKSKDWKVIVDHGSEPLFIAVRN